MQQTTAPYKPLRFLIAGGGTGGHIFPAIAIAQALQVLAPGSEFLFVGANGKMEMEKVPAAGFSIKGITISGFDRSSWIKNISLPLKLIKSFWEVSRIIGQYKPDAVLGVGGYSTFPVLRYAQSKNIPSFIHEANSFGGKSNILLSKKATRVYTGTAGMEKFFPATKILCTGNPVRKQIVSNAGKISQHAARDNFGLNPAKTTLLIIGGSLGAKSINEAIAGGLKQLTQNGLQLIWQTGKPFYAKAQEAVKGMHDVKVMDFITNMEQAYAAADMVVSRAGAMAIAELCIVGQAVIFVPYPFAAEDHQTANAMNLVKQDAALMIADAEAPAKLISSMLRLAGDPDKQASMKEAIQKLAIPDADIRVAKDMLQQLAAGA